ncbi:extracellular solute-binding protein [Paenibacillus sp. SYP-B4298]|uniref:extracellular solute-binding protein n=1 Tax=Paenibacillus sp. SYP-B4298 TaxID=2996034 RepID=UPI0022DD047C|nr:extracellular solute-binding protein [Paenibacillus sp. SYP-B4298]
MLRTSWLTRGKPILMSMLITAVLVTGCSTGSGDQPTPSNGSSTTPTVSNGDPAKLRRLVPEGETATLKVWRPTHTSIGTIIEKWNDTLFNKWMEEQTGVKIEWITPVSGTEADNLAMIVSSGEYPDLFFDAGGVYPTGAYGLLKDGVVINVADYLDRLPNFKKQLEKSELRRIESYSDNKELAAFYRYSANDELATTWYGILMRKDLLDKVNKEVPQTYDEWHDVLTAFKNAGVEKPFLLNSTGFPKLNVFTGGLGFGYMNYGGGTVPFYQVDGKVRYAPLEDGFKSYLMMMNKWYAEGLIDSDFLSLNSLSAEFAAYGDVQSGSMVAPLSVAKVVKQLNPDAGLEFVAVPHPVVNKGDKIHIGGSPTTTVSAGMQISAKTKKLDLALQWADLYYSEDVIQAGNFGPDPSYYEQDAAGNIHFNDNVFANKDGFAIVDMMTTIADYPVITVNDRDINDELLLKQGQMYDEQNDHAYTISSKLTMTDEESKVYNSIMTDIIDYVEEMQVKYILGIESFDNYDAFVQHIKDKRIAEAMAVYQTALDRYNAR